MQKTGETRRKTNIINIIRAETISELTEKLDRLDGAVRLGFEIKLDICVGLFIIYAGYRKEIYEFCNAFGFMPDYDVTAYKYAVYLYDENEIKNSWEYFQGLTIRVINQNLLLIPLPTCWKS